MVLCIRRTIPAMGKSRTQADLERISIMTDYYYEAAREGEPFEGCGTTRVTAQRLFQIVLTLTHPLNPSDGGESTLSSPLGRGGGLPACGG